MSSESKIVNGARVTMMDDEEATHLYTPVKRDGKRVCQHCDRPKKDRIHLPNTRKHAQSLTDEELKAALEISGGARRARH